jgi:hypothetical protein
MDAKVTNLFDLGLLDVAAAGCEKTSSPTKTERSSEPSMFRE